MEQDLLGPLARPGEAKGAELGWTDLDPENDFTFVASRAAGHEEVKGLTRLGRGRPFDLKPVGIRSKLGRARSGQAWKFMR